MKTIGIGVIGWGFMGKTHTHAIRSIPLFYPGAPFRAELKCVCSRRLEMAKQAAEELGFESYTDDYRELLARDDVDVVSICTPNELHEDMAIAAIKAGKHVYIDKPLAVTAESAVRIAEAAKAHPEVLTRMVFNNRYFPSTMRAHQLVEEGKIGEVISFSARYLHSGAIDPNKPVGWKQLMQGGVLLDLGSHALDLITWLCGYPTEVFCATRVLYDNRPTKEGGTVTDLSEDHVLMMLRLPNGAIGTVEASKIATGSNDELTFDVRGDKGALRWDGMNASYVEFMDNTVPETTLGGERGFTAIESVARYPAPAGSFLPPKNAIGWDRGHTHCYYTFLDCVARGEKPDNPIEDGARLQALMGALAESAKTGAWVKVEG